jgi:hypothetical protein
MHIQNFSQRIIPFGDAKALDEAIIDAEIGRDSDRLGRTGKMLAEQQLEAAVALLGKALSGESYHPVSAVPSNNVARAVAGQRCACL